MSRYGKKEEQWKTILKSLDAFPKQRDEAAEFFHRSVSGGVITVVTGLLMALLFFSELGMKLFSYLLPFLPQV